MAQAVSAHKPATPGNTQSTRRAPEYSKAEPRYGRRGEGDIRGEWGMKQV